jgi:3-oxoadipate enol-lactonase / 4-carboxymuconolactone decarboxylase
MFLRTRDLTIHVRVEGPPGAPVLLLLHSLGATHVIWDAQAAVLSSAFRVVRPDMRGHGLTGLTPGPYSMDQLAHDALAVLDGLGAGEAHVAGISIGGMIAQRMASTHPGRVTSLVLCDTALSIPPAQTWHDRAALVRREGMAPLLEPVITRWVTPPFLQAPETDGLRAMLLRTPPEGYAGAAEAIAGADLTAGSATISAPTLVLVGDGDVSTPVAAAEVLARTIPGARAEVLADAAHIPTVERPAAVLEAMQHFLASIEAGRRNAKRL